MRHHLSLKSALLLAGSVLSLAVADRAAEAADTTPASVDELAPVVVSAQKREQNQLDVPITMQAFSGDYVSKVGVQNLTDLSTLTPGFYVQNQSSQNPGLVMRGITDDNAGPTDEARVSVYQDGVSISRITTASTELFDVQRIEVEKGPQSTLFGRSALTGAVNIIQNKASERGYDWNAKAEAGNYGYRDAEGMVNIPLTDSLAIRFAGRVKTREGYVTNLLDPGLSNRLNSDNTTAFRMAVNYSAERYTNDLLLNVEQDHNTGVDYKSVDFYPTNPATGAVIGNLNPYSAVALNPDANAASGNHLFVHRRLIGVTDIATLKLGNGFKLTSTTAWRHDYFNERGDNDGTAIQLINSNTFGGGHQYSQEFRLNYDAGGRFTAFGGLSYFQESTQGATQVGYGQPALLGLLLNTAGPLNRVTHVIPPAGYYGSVAVVQPEIAGLLGFRPTDPGFAQEYGLAGALAANITGANAVHNEQATTVSRDQSYDAFVDGSYKLTPKLEVSAGLRLSHDEKTTLYSASVSDRSVLGGLIALGSLPASIRPALLAGLANPLAPSLLIPNSVLPAFALLGQPTENNGQYDSGKLSNDSVSWRLTSRYALSDTQSLYATYSRGVRPRVLTGVSGAAPETAAVFNPLAAETLDNYEAGYKAALFDKSLSVDTAVYINDYQHFSTTVVQQGRYVSIDAGQAQTYGFEAQLIWSVMKGVDLFGAYAYTHGRFGTGLYDGNHFRLTPDHTVSLGGAYRFAAVGGTIEVLPRYQWKSKYYFNEDNGKLSEQNYILNEITTNQYQNAFGLLDLRVGYSPAGQSWKLELYSTNLTNQKFLKDAGNVGQSIGVPTYIPGEPRFYGLSFSIRN